jgi:hypothetical protein
MRIHQVFKKGEAKGREVELFWGGFNQNSSVKNLLKNKSS